MFRLLLHYSLLILTRASSDDIIYYNSNETYSDSSSETLRPNGTRIRIDRSAMLEIFFDETKNPYTFLTCPRLFGKTSLIAMLEDFAELETDEYGLPYHYEQTYRYQYHKNLRIFNRTDTVSKHLSRYPVILLDLFTNTYQAITVAHLVRDLKSQLKQCFEKYKWLPELLPRGSSALKITKSDVLFVEQAINGTLAEDDIKGCLFRLSKILHNFFNQTKVIILVNEYDSAMLTSLVTQRTDIVKFYQMINEMLHKAFKTGSRYVAYGLISATSSLGYYLSYPSLFSNIVHRSFLANHPFNTFCGISEQEAEIDLYDKYKLTRRERGRIRKYYGGYQIRSKNISLYNPHSLMNYFLWNPPIIGTYWNIGFGHEIFVRFLDNEYFLKTVYKMSERHTMQIPFDLSDKYSATALSILSRVRKDDYQDFKADDIRQRIMLTFTLEQGYIIRGSSPNQIELPNLEVRQKIQTGVLEHYQNKRMSAMNITKIMLGLLKSPDD